MNIEEMAAQIKDLEETLKITREWFDRLVERNRRTEEERDAALRALENKS